jgi:hypothetical protein
LRFELWLSARLFSSRDFAPSVSFWETQRTNTISGAFVIHRWEISFHQRLLQPFILLRCFPEDFIWIKTTSRRNVTGMMVSIGPKMAELFGLVLSF